MIATKTMIIIMIMRMNDDGGDNDERSVFTRAADKKLFYFPTFLCRLFPLLPIMFVIDQSEIDHCYR